MTVGDLKPPGEAEAGSSTEQRLGPNQLASGAGLLVRGALNGHVGRFSGIAVWACFVIIFSVWIPSTFLTTTTLDSVFSGQAITMIIAMGLLPAFAAGQFDLSAAQNVGLSAVICGLLMTKSHLGWGEAAAITAACGALIGATNGALVLIGVDSFIATLGMSSILLALTELASSDNYVGPLPNSFGHIANNSIDGVQLVTIYAFVLALLVWYVLEHSPAGRRTSATGANRDAARLAGVRTHRYVLGSLVFSGLIASLAGVLVAARIGEVSPTLGPPYLLPVFAACFLGTTQVKVGRFNVWGTVIAIFLLATGVEGLQLAGGQLWVTDMFDGVALVGAVTIAVLGGKRREARLRAEASRA